jgi:hypothetical protein
MMTMTTGSNNLKPARSTMNSTDTTMSMTNAGIIFMNNSAVDSLNAGDIANAYKLLTRIFSHSIRHKHSTHNLKPPANDGRGLEFSLQDCSKYLARAMNKGQPDDYSCQSFFCLNFLRIDLPPGEPARRSVEGLCNCSIVWALGYNLALVHALIGFQRGYNCIGKRSFTKSLRMLGPIKRQIMLQTSQSPFWTNLKLCILNNHMCINSEIQNQAEVACTVRTMGGLLVHSRDHLDPIDVKKYYLSIQFLNISNSFAAAA